MFAPKMKRKWGKKDTRLWWFAQAFLFALRNQCQTIPWEPSGFILEAFWTKAWGSRAQISTRIHQELAENPPRTRQELAQQPSLQTKTKKKGGAAVSPQRGHSIERIKRKIRMVKLFVGRKLVVVTKSVGLGLTELSFNLWKALDEI